MAIILVDDVIQITAHGTIAGRPWASVWGMTNAAGAIDMGTEVQAVVNDFADNFQDHILQALCNTVVLSGYTWVSLNSADGHVGAMGPRSGKATTGANTDAALPPNCCFLIRKQASVGRGKRGGRSYLPGVPEGVVGGDGSIAQGLVDGVNDHLQNFLDGVSDGGFEAPRYPVVIHRPPIPPGTPSNALLQGSHSRITALSCDGRVATQRRRLRG